MIWRFLLQCCCNFFFFLILLREEVKDVTQNFSLVFASHKVVFLLSSVLSLTSESVGGK